MVDYDPFGKPLSEISFEDIESLQGQNVSEGYYVELKRAIPGSDPGKSVAKVIASFANTYGGWLFIGVSEKENNVFGEITGISLSENPQPKETVIQWSRTRIDPTPEIHSQLITIPDTEDSAVLIVQVPWSWNTPHIMTDGKIYRRTGEASNPIEPETERWTLDKLYQRRNEYLEKRTRGIQHLRGLKEEIETNHSRVEGNDRVIRQLQSGRTRSEVEHYIIEHFATDSWNASLDAELMDVIGTDLYREIQQLYYSMKSVNEMISRTQSEFPTPDVLERLQGNSDIQWTVVSYWDYNDEEVDYTGLPVLIMNRMNDFKNVLSTLPDDIESEIKRLEAEIGRD